MANQATILIVDDEPLNVDLLEQELSGLGFNTISAANGQLAIDTVKERYCDLVLLDIMMPEMSGYDVLEHWRNKGLLAELPVIVISADDNLNSVVRCIELGAEDYLTKPFEPTLLRARIQATLEKKLLHDKVAQQLAITRKIFGKFVPTSVAEAILEGQGDLEPVQTIATILYTDIEGFTSIVEGMLPGQVMQMLNEYFTAVIEPIKHHGGIVNQFQGDAMLVTFNVPIADSQHAAKAVQAAVEIQKILKERRFAGVPLPTRIGISTGEVVAGNVGSGDRVNYTVHGDAVNLAARFEELNKEYGTHTLISDATVAELGDGYPIELVGDVPIRGKQAFVRAYKLAG